MTEYLDHISIDDIDRIEAEFLDLLREVEHRPDSYYGSPHELVHDARICVPARRRALKAWRKREQRIFRVDGNRGRLRRIDDINQAINSLKFVSG